MTKLFLSYARGDDEPFVRRLYNDLTARGFDVWFDRQSMPSRNLTFHQEIRDAVAACDRLVLVVGPKAVASDYVRQEWQFAYFEADKVVTPILRLGDYPLAIDELKLVHCEDFRDDAEYQQHLDQLVRILNEPPPPLGKLIGVPSLPAHFLSRSAGLTKLRDALRADLDSPVVIGGAAAKVGLHGMGGIGKSVLANALVRDRKIREAFGDGIVWVGLGSLPNLAERMRDVHRALGGDGAFATEHEGKVRLKELLADKAVLLVLDDAWRRGDVDAFDVLGPRCRALITTRDVGLATSLSGTHYVVELLTESEALRLLAVAAGVETDALPPEAHEVLAECGKLPLAVALAGGMVEAGTPWQDVRDALREHELEFLEDPQAQNEQHVNLWRTIEVSVRALSADVQQRLAELAVFPEDEQVPEAAVCTLWQQTGNLSPRHARKLLVDLKQRSLVQLARDTKAAAGGVGEVSLHDLIHDYCVRLAQQQFGDAAALHTRLLDAYRAACPDGWWTGPNDGYFLDHLRDHLVAAGRGEELADLLHELQWLEAKNTAGLAFDLPHDYRVAIAARPEQDDHHRFLKLLDEALRRDLHFIDRHREDYSQALFQCLWNHGWWYDCPAAAAHYDPPARRWPADGRPWTRPAGDRLATLLEAWREAKERRSQGFAWTSSLRPPDLGLEGRQMMCIRGQHSAVRSVAWSPDGRRIASGSNDATVRIWDASSGAELACFSGRESNVAAVAWSPDGRQIASGSGDGSVRIWEVDRGTELECLFGHQEGIWGVAWSPNGHQIVSGSKDLTVRIWESSSGRECSCIGHPGYAMCVAWSPDGSRIASGSSDGTARVWDVGSIPEQGQIHKFYDSVLSVAWSSDGQRIAFGMAGEHASVEVWDSRFTSTLSTFSRFKGTEFWSVTWSPDGQQIATCTNDGELFVFDSNEGTELACIRGHEDWVMSVAWSPDGRRIVSGSRDRTVRIWDAARDSVQAFPKGHRWPISCIAWSPDGRFVATGSMDRTVKVWAFTGEVLLAHEYEHDDWVSSLAWSPDGRFIVIGSTSEDDTVVVWEVETGAVRLRIFDGLSMPMCVSWSHDGRRILSGSREKTICVRNAESGNELLCLHGHHDSVWSVSWSPDDRFLASGSEDKTVRIWEAASGAEITCIRGHTGSVSCVAFDRDGLRIASGSNDNTVRVWDARTGECLEVIEGHGDVAAMAAGPAAFAWRAISRGGETVIEAAATGQVAARFPVALEKLTTAPDGRHWAGCVGSHLYLIQLESPPPNAAPP